MATTDWIHRTHEGRYDQANLTGNYINDPLNRDRMGLGANTPTGNWFDASYTPAFTAFTAAYLDWQDAANRTPLKTTKLEETEKAFISVYRELHNFLKGNPVVTDEDLQAMGMPKRSAGGHKSNPAPTTRIVANVLLTGPGTLDVHYHDETTKSNAKPAGVHGAELRSRVSDTPVTLHGELTESQFDTHTPFHLTFPDEQRGKTFYYSLRWENTTGEKGPWNEIQSAIIP